MGEVQIIVVACTMVAGHVMPIGQSFTGNGMEQFVTNVDHERGNKVHFCFHHMDQWLTDTQPTVLARASGTGFVSKYSRIATISRSCCSAYARRGRRIASSAPSGHRIDQ